MINQYTLVAGLLALGAACSQFAHADTLPDPLALPAAKTDKPVAPQASTPAPARPAAPAASSPAATAAIATAPAPSKAADPVAPVTTPSATTTERAATTRASGPTFRQLDELRTQNALLVEMVKSAEMRAKLAGQTQAAGGVGANSLSNANAAQVVSVFGLDGKLTAVIALANGSTVKAREGISIPGIGRVTSITQDEVIVTTKTGPVSLSFVPVNTFPGAR